MVAQARWRAGHRPCDARRLTGALRRALAALCHHRRRRRRQQRRRQALQKVAGGPGQFSAVLTSLPKGPCQSLSTASFPAPCPAVSAPDHRHATRATQDGLQRVDSDCPGPAHRAGIRYQVAGAEHRQAPRTLGFRPQRPTQRAPEKAPKQTRAGYKVSALQSSSAPALKGRRFFGAI